MALSSKNIVSRAYDAVEQKATSGIYWGVVAAAGATAVAEEVLNRHRYNTAQRQAAHDELEGASKQALDRLNVSADVHGVRAYTTEDGTLTISESTAPSASWTTVKKHTGIDAEGGSHFSQACLSETSRVSGVMEKDVTEIHGSIINGGLDPQPIAFTRELIAEISDL